MLGVFYEGEKVVTCPQFSTNATSCRLTIQMLFLLMSRHLCLVRNRQGMTIMSASVRSINNHLQQKLIIVLLKVQCLVGTRGGFRWISVL